MQIKEAIVRLVNLLMRDEGPETAIETLDDDEGASDIPPAPEPSTLFVSADGKEQAQPDAAVEEDQDDVIEEVQDAEGPPQHHNVPLSTMQVRLDSPPCSSLRPPLPFLVLFANHPLFPQPEEDEDEMLLEV